MSDDTQKEILKKIYLIAKPNESEKNRDNDTLTKVNEIIFS
jgi:hypothetical protein